MGNSLRYWLACVLPCGALDLIRVVHISGHVDQFSRPLPAASILAANPNHVLTKPSPHSPTGAIVVAPDSDLRRGNIYFLVPDPTAGAVSHKRKPPPVEGPSSVATPPDRPTDDDEVLPERKATHRRRRSGRVGVWRQQLESIVEDDD